METVRQRVAGLVFRVSIHVLRVSQAIKNRKGSWTEIFAHAGNPWPMVVMVKSGFFFIQKLSEKTGCLIQAAAGLYIFSTQSHVIRKMSNGSYLIFIYFLSRLSINGNIVTMNRKEINNMHMPSGKTTT